MLAALECQLVIWRGLCNRRAGSYCRPLANLDRRDELDTGTDKRAVADAGTVLVNSVVITGDRACADVDVCADIGVADVRQVIDLTAGGNLALLDLDKISDLDVGGQLSAGAQAQLSPAVAPSI